MLWCAIVCFRVVRRGLIHFGPDCKSFAWISRFQSGRADDIIGDERNFDVVVGNVMALFVSWVCTHLHFAGVYFSIEQPVCSNFKHHPAILSLMQRVDIFRLCTHLGAFDKRMPIPKAVHLYFQRFAPLAGALGSGERGAGGGGSSVDPQRGRLVRAPTRE